MRFIHIASILPAIYLELDNFFKILKNYWKYEEFFKCVIKHNLMD